GLTYPPERDAVGMDPKRRGAVIDEVLPVLRRLWAGETVSYDGLAGSFRDVRLSPLPLQKPLEVWLGGNVPPAVQRCGPLPARRPRGRGQAPGRAGRGAGGGGGRGGRPGRHSGGGPPGGAARAAPSARAGPRVPPAARPPPPLRA